MDNIEYKICTSNYMHVAFFFSSYKKIKKYQSPNFQHYFSWKFLPDGNCLVYMIATD